ncbi:MAG: RDD family protein [Myxococcota bacterium]
MTDDDIKALHDFEDTAVPTDLASLSQRWLAGAIDYALFGAGLFAGAALGMGLARLSGSSAVTLMTLGTAMLGALIPSVISWVLITRDGQSLGKRWVGIRIVTRGGQPPGFLRGVVLRNWVLQLVDRACGFLFFIDHAAILLRERRAIHDYIAGTWVIDPN